jgi:hypothetical protein
MPRGVEKPYAVKCACGAVTVVTLEGDYSMRPAEYRRRFGKAPPRTVRYSNCNHCVNHWGVDLCGCGSGERFGRCKEGLKECSRPAQDMEEGVLGCSCKGSWGGRR